MSVTFTISFSFNEEQLEQNSVHITHYESSKHYFISPTAFNQVTSNKSRHYNYF